MVGNNNLQEVQETVSIVPYSSINANWNKVITYYPPKKRFAKIKSIINFICYRNLMIRVIREMIFYASYPPPAQIRRTMSLKLITILIAMLYPLLTTEMIASFVITSFLIDKGIQIGTVYYLAFTDHDNRYYYVKRIPYKPWEPEKEEEPLDQNAFPYPALDVKVLEWMEPLVLKDIEQELKVEMRRLQGKINSLEYLLSLRLLVARRMIFRHKRRYKRLEKYKLKLKWPKKPKTAAQKEAIRHARRVKYVNLIKKRFSKVQKLIFQIPRIPRKCYGYVEDSVEFTWDMILAHAGLADIGMSILISYIQEEIEFIFDKIEKREEILKVKRAERKQFSDSLRSIITVQNIPELLWSVQEYAYEQDKIREERRWTEELDRIEKQKPPYPGVSKALILKYRKRESERFGASYNWIADKIDQDLYDTQAEREAVREEAAKLRRMVWIILISSTFLCVEVKYHPVCFIISSGFGMISYTFGLTRKSFVFIGKTHVGMIIKMLIEGQQIKYK